MPKQKRTVRIYHTVTNELIAEGPIGWGIMPFEGNYYISKKYLKTKRFKLSFIPGVCIYKFIYLWMHYKIEDNSTGKQKYDKFLGWMYVLPNPLFPFIWFRVGIPTVHSSIRIEES